LKHLERFWPLLLIGALIALLVFSGALNYLSIDRLQTHQVELRAWVDANPWTAGLIQFSLATLLMATALPGTALVNLAAGFLFGAVLATGQGVAGTVLGSWLLYLAVQHAIGERLASRGRALSDRIRAAFERNPTSYALFLRLVPAFPFGMTTLALALLRCPPKLFLGASLLGCLPSTFAICWLGAGLGDQLMQPEPIDLNLLRQPTILLPLVALALLALLPVLVNRWRGTPPVA
jgi:uncharacterized membrane protein YdjX (TVP38/TMEM64 family)